MAWFKNRRPGSNPTSPPKPAAPSWSPTVNMQTARPAVFALADAPASDAAQVRSAIATFVRLSEKPSMDDPRQAAQAYMQDPECLHRPWVWLAAVMRQAAAASDHHTAVAALFWACYWTSDLVPRNNLGGLLELELDPIPERHKAEILSLGLASAHQLPADFLIVGDETGSVRAGWLADVAAAQLGL